ncbi:MAG: hypothetical protein RMJ48_00610 [Roseiflexaceae bacterium]|nr:hypothetical protein [Roseiflexaceae bacterium]
MSNRTVLPVARASFERVMPIISLMILVLIVAQALVQSVSAWLSGAEMTHVVPVFEAPIANAGRALGTALTSWMPVWVLPTPFGPLDVKYTASYTLYEWFKLPIILFLTTYGMTLLRLRVSTKWIERSIGRNDLIRGGWRRSAGHVSRRSAPAPSPISTQALWLAARASARRRRSCSPVRH